MRDIFKREALRRKEVLQNFTEGSESQGGKIGVGWSYKEMVLGQSESTLDNVS